jgi:adenosylcobinamide-GDP ribazoletransferase
MTEEAAQEASQQGGRLRHELRLVCIALQFLTRVPAPAWVGYRPAWLNASARHFPLIGAFVGGVGALVLMVAAAWWPPAVAALLSLAATLVLTGAFHEDGLADTFDALGGAVPRERALAIMKDSRIGTYGAVALVCVLAARVLLLATLCARMPAAAAAALVLSQCWGRAAAVWLMARLPYAGDAEHAKAKPLATAVRVAEVVGAMFWAATIGALIAWLAPWSSPGQAAMRLGAAFAATVIVALAMRRWLTRRLSGYTGDTLGATEQLAEVAILLALAAQ